MKMDLNGLPFFKKLARMNSISQRYVQIPCGAVLLQRQFICPGQSGWL
jgi:hypothetical protein